MVKIRTVLFCQQQNPNGTKCLQASFIRRHPPSSLINEQQVSSDLHSQQNCRSFARIEQPNSICRDSVAAL